MPQVKLNLKEDAKRGRLPGNSSLFYLNDEMSGALSMEREREGAKVF